MNLNFSKTFNNESYNVALSIYSTNLTLTSPSNMLDDKDAMPIPTENITYMMFENSIVDIIPVAEFEILDHDFILTSKLKTENTRIKCSIMKTGGAKVKDNPFELIWIVKKYDILNMSPTSIHYKIRCELDCAIPLYTICNYATMQDLANDVNSGENPYTIIRNILTSVNFKLYPEMIKDEHGVEVRGRYSPPSCNTKINFISNQNMYTIDAVKYLLSVACGTLQPSQPAYLIYNMKDNKGFITSRENLFKESSIKMQPESINCFYSITNSSLGRQFQIRDIKADSAKLELGGIENPKLFHNHNFYKYDHKERLWENDRISKYELDDILTKGMTPSKHQSLFLKTSEEDLELTKYYQYPTIHNYKLYEALTELELFSSNIQFTVDGDLNLDVGHILNIKEDSVKHKMEMFHGHWMVVKVRHSFRNKEYKMNVICSRTYYTKVI